MGTSKYKESTKGAYYHLFNRGNQKREIFLQKDDYIFYLKRIKQACEKYEFALICYCLIPNHVHYITRQDNAYPPSKLMSSLHTSYSIMFNKKYGTVGHLFQSRFKQKIITNDDYMKSLIAYIHFNPVKHKICKFPKDYQWSSYREYANLKDSPSISSICDQSLINSYGLKGLSFEEFINIANRIDESEAFD